MKIVGYTNKTPLDSPNFLIDLEGPKPVAVGKDLLVKIEAISVNPVDTKVRERVTPETEEVKVLGWDAVGVVESLGDEVSYFKVGDRVWYAGDLLRQGSNAEYQLVDERIVGHAPKSLSPIESAALPLTTITAWELLFDRLCLNEESSGKLLVIAGAGGVGSILIQLCKQLTSIEVIATASRAESTSWVKDMGADHVINHHKPLSEELSKIGIGEVDYIISLNQTEKHFEEIVKSIKPQGKFALIDDPVEPLNINLLKQKSVSLHWEFMYTRSMFETEDISEQHKLLNAVSSMIDKGKIKSTYKEKFDKINAENIMKAHKKLKSHTSIGKIVLEW